MITEKKILKDEVDLNSLLAVFFENLNLLISIFLASILIITIYYFSSSRLYQSDSLLEIKSETRTNFLPDSLGGALPIIKSDESLIAEIEIYKSENTINGALDLIRKTNKFPIDDIPTFSSVRKNLYVRNRSKNLLEISFVSDNKELSTILLNYLNVEFIEDRKDFVKQSSRAGRTFIQSEVPRIKELLKKAEENLNNFKILSKFIVQTYSCNKNHPNAPFSIYQPGAVKNEGF